MSDGRSSGGGITFFGALQVLLIGLKLTNNIDWPWSLVLVPLWLEIALVIAAILIVVATYDPWDF